MATHHGSDHMGCGRHPGATDGATSGGALPGGHQPDEGALTDQLERARRRHRKMLEWEGIVQKWAFDMADPGSPFGQIAEKVRRAQFREQLRVEREARGDKEILKWWEQLKRTQHN